MSDTKKNRKNLPKRSSDSQDNSVQDKGSPKLLEAIEQATEIPRKEKQKLVAMVSQYKGVLPPGDLAQIYEKLCPGAMDRIISMAEKDQEHNYEIEKARAEWMGQFLPNAYEITKRGQYFGGIIALTSLGMSFALFLLGMPFHGIPFILFPAAQFTRFILKSNFFDSSPDSRND